MKPDRDAILKALENVIDPELKRPVTELDMVRDVLVEEDGSVSVTIALTVAGCPLRDSFSEQVSRFVGEVPGVTRVRLGFDVMTPEEKSALVSRLRGGHSADRTISLSPGTRVIAVASGKGGVGKSTLTANLAYALSELGEQVGVLDGDIYGHSIPHMLGIHQKPIAVDEMIVPPVRGDLKLMSIGFFLEENAPIMWRGPMLHKALEQFLSDVHWGELDTLLVDMPPGTGDVAMSLGQLLPRAEALVVTTPQPAAQQVAVRAAQMAQKTGMRVLGAVENMSYLAGTGQELFGSGGGQALADEMGVPLLARIPLDPLMREAADDGCPGRRGRSRLGGRRGGRGARRVGRRAARGRDPEAAHRPLVESPRAGRRVLRPRSNADLALELACARARVSPTRAASPPRPVEGHGRPARLRSLRGGEGAGRADGRERDGLPEGAAGGDDARDRRGGSRLGVSTARLPRRARPRRASTASAASARTSCPPRCRRSSTRSSPSSGSTEASVHRRGRGRRLHGSSRSSA